MTIITKAALAAELRVSKARVSQYLKRGMPQRSDGKLNRDDAIAWIGAHNFPQAPSDKGADRARRLTRETAVKPAKASKASEPQAAEAARSPSYKLVDDAQEPFDRGALAMAVTLYPRMGSIAACLAVHCGASLSVAHALKGCMEVAFFEEAVSALRHQGVPPFDRDDYEDVPWIDPDLIRDVNWSLLSAQTGEPIDIPAWKAAYKAREAAANV